LKSGLEHDKVERKPVVFGFGIFEDRRTCVRTFAAQDAAAIKTLAVGRPHCHWFVRFEIVPQPQRL